MRSSTKLGRGEEEWSGGEGEDGYYHVFHDKDRVWRRVGGGEECDGNQGGCFVGAETGI